MRILLLVCILTNAFSLISQEELAPLEFNSNLKRAHTVEKTGAAHETYIYTFDTLNLPFIDDFTENHFKTFDAQPSDPNVTAETTYRIEIGGTAVPMGSVYMYDTTFRFQYDTVTGYGFDSIILTSKTPFSATLAEIFNIDAYPINSQVKSVWPNYNVYDSLWNPPSSLDTAYIPAVDADVFQDSSTIYFVSEEPADSLIYWQDNSVYHNYTYATNIQTLGVASFDGLDANGYPYDFTSPSAVGKADVLTSKPINMGSYSLADSVYFSFLVEPGGLGEAPEADDSLVVQFWSPLSAEWTTVLNITGYDSDVFDMHLIKITNGLYFQDGFQFRFINYGTLTGSLDVWHIDYVYLNELREYDDLLVADWAFSNPSPSFIKDFTAMPWPHYEFAPEDNMIEDYAATTYNSADFSPLINPCDMRLFYETNLLSTLNYGSGTSNVPSLSYFDMEYTIPTTFWFDTIYADTCADFTVTQYIDNNGLSSTELLVNDTLRHTQHFSNYYSYDDGTAEAAYGLVKNEAELAYKFTLAPGLSDSIRALSMHFSPSVNDVSQESFFIQIWDDFNGEPGNVIYTSDATLPTLYYPEYSDENNGFIEYELTEKVKVSGTYYVGWKQSSAARLNIGFDKNINTQDRIYYKTSSNWANTGYEGSLMMRPVFISDKDLALSIDEATLVKPNVNIYPNPANRFVTLASDQKIESVEIYDISGQLVQTVNLATTNSTISTEDLTEGIYIFNILSTDNQSVQKKINIIR